MAREYRKSKWNWKSLLKRLAMASVILFLVLAGIGQIQKQRLRTKVPPPGKLVEIGDHRLHINCAGKGQPTVIFEAGLGDFSTVWTLIQSKVSEKVHACSYDRAGMGWSERSPNVDSVMDIANDLHTLLNNAGVQGPYILVGHSMGGLYARQYASLYPDEVVGMVLVDSAHEEQILRMPESYRKADAKIASQTRKTLNLLRPLNKLGFLALFPSLIPVTHTELPLSVQAANRSLILSDSRYIETLIDDYRSYPERINQIRESNLTMRDIPLIVISHGYPQPPFELMGMTETTLQQYEPIWQDMQRDLSELSLQGELRVAKESDHYIQLKQPELIVNSINDILQGLYDPS